MQKRLFEIIAGLEALNHPAANPLITSLEYDSRKVTAGSLFFALPGLHVHGNSFIEKALEHGASAVIFEDDGSTLCKQYQSDERAAFVYVKNARLSMSPAAAAFYEEPSKKLCVIGVTGTEGKSSTVSFIWQLLRLCGKKSGFISTVEYSFGENAIPNPNHETTPEAPVVQRELYEMLQNACEYAVVEASSHGLSKELGRLSDVAFRAGIMMNVTHEHLEFHKTFERYRSDKAELFRALNQAKGSFGIVNADDKSAEYFAAATKAPVYSISKELSGKSIGAAADFTIRGIKSDAKGTAFEFSYFPRGKDKDASVCSIHTVETPLPGAFNAHNVLSAIAAVHKLTGFPVEEIAQKCKNLQSVKGRMSVIDEGQDFEIIVDYAHTPSSFQTIFPPIRERIKAADENAKIIAVFGSGGERDREKRPEQGRIAAEFCDIVILTDEDPRGEDRFELLEEIEKGCIQAGKTRGKDVFLIPDRIEAIHQAFTFAAKSQAGKNGNCVLLLGKAHENSIIYKDFSMPYDEIAEAKKEAKKFASRV